MIKGMEEVTYGVPDMKPAHTFFTDWGLKRRSASKTRSVYETEDGTRVIVKPNSAEDLPPAIQPGGGVREIIWGVTAKSDLTRLQRELEKDREVKVAKDGTIRALDPMGLTIGFRVTQRRRLKKSAVAREQINSPTHVERVDRASKVYKRATPLTLGHAVFNVPDLKAYGEFYMKRLGFGLSDRYFKDGKLRGLFMRCSTPGDHHNLFVMQSETGKASLNHIAFKVRDVHEVFGGGLYLTKKGWPTEIGPGRHPISSAYFWYFKNPCGGAIEYYTDEDHLTEKWKPHNYDSVPENFAEWALPTGIAKHSVDIKER